MNAPVLRILVSIAILVVLLFSIDTAGIFARLVNIDIRAVAVAALLLMAGQWLNALRWRLVLRPLLAEAPLPGVSVLFRLVMLGTFFNTFLPTTVGGDVVRAEMSQRLLGGRVTAYVSILMSRVLGLSATLILGTIALSFAVQTYAALKPVLALMLTCCVVMAAFAGLVLAKPRRFEQAGRGAASGWRRAVREVAAAMVAFTGHRGMLVAALAISAVIIAVGLIGSVWALSVGLSLNVPASMHWIAVPVMLIVTLLPISFNGVGLREAVFVVLYAAAGVDAASAVTLGLAMSSLITLVGLASGLLLMRSVVGRSRSAPANPRND